MPHYDLELFADYFQFYVQDEPANGDLSGAWSNEAVARLLAVAPGVVGVGTVRNMDVPVTIEIHSVEPLADLEASDHVVECSLLVKSGRIVAAGCTDYFPEAKRIDLPSGTYRVRVSYSGLGSLSADGLEGNDRYRLQLWQAPEVEPSVLKQRAV
jgi:hypothetical protein